MSDIKQAYRILKLESDASFKQVMEAHRDMAVVWDPRLHGNHPRLHRKATENLARVNQAFQLIRRHHLGAQIEPEEELEEPVEQAGAESEERESSCMRRSSRIGLPKLRERCRLGRSFLRFWH